MPRTTTVLLPDVNVLLAGFRADHVHHRAARAFLEAARSGTVTLAMSDVALTSLVRLATNQRVFVQPDTADAVLGIPPILRSPEFLRRKRRERMGHICEDEACLPGAVPAGGA
jgi:predicted nucleic acid-binding protein